MSTINLIAENPESTVVAEFLPDEIRESAYQSEAQLEQAFIERLQLQGYEYLDITTESDIIANLRKQLERLNHIRFTDSEWDQFFRRCVANQNNGIQEKTAIIQEDHIQLLTRDNGTTKNIYLLDKDNIHNNSLQVINQYTPEGGARDNRYDVTILVNGLPLVHVELKRRGVDIREAFNQINRYSRESFWSGSGLFEFVQIFIISNGTYTKYYSNTTRSAHLKESTGKASKLGKKTSNSFEFTSWWADAANRPITDLMDFVRTFLMRHTLLNILARYCVFTTDKILLVMRPYQIVATERILNRIQIAHNYKQFGSVSAGGFIWHTTGSGKTLTSFKTAQLASRLPYIAKVLFVVDRKDLDYQTIKEYDRFEKDAANSNTNTAILKKQLESSSARIIITTIQKLAVFIKKNKNHPSFQEPIVIIFDECHRSQFGDMHKAIVKSFKKYYLFGFTGTPIFAQNAQTSIKTLAFATTGQAFGAKLHTYTIVDAINDKNVLPFRIDYIRTMKEAEDIRDKKVLDIDRENALKAPQRIANIVTYILDHFNQKTKRTERDYEFKTLRNIQEVATAKDRKKAVELRQAVRLTGFNSIFAVASIETARLYYIEFQKQQAAMEPFRRLKIATIFSFAPNEEQIDGLLDDENSEDTNGLDQSSRDFLDAAIADYNHTFQTNYDTSADKFQNYYKDVSLRMKNREIDLLIVVNMFLTGFDATTLNTLWVDKNLRMHGLLQAFSRTNRILNSIKTFGNIVCFRNLEEATNASLALFGDKEASGQVLLKTFNDYYFGYKDEKGKKVPGYVDLISRLAEQFPVGQPIIGESAQKEFIKLYGAILKLTNILSAFDEFAGKEILSARDIQDYRSIYIDLYSEFRIQKKGDRENINDDIVFEIELIKQVDINIDYILLMIRKYHDGNMKDKEIIVKIKKAIDASLELRNKKDLIERFIETLAPSSNVDEDWVQFINENRVAELNTIIDEENLNRDETYEFVQNAFRDGFVQTTGTAVAAILPPVSRFTPSGDRTVKRETVLDKLKAFFERFWNIAGGTFKKP